MSSLYFSCGSGISGDMVVGSLLDLGIDEGFLTSELRKLHLSGFSVSSRKVLKCGVSATKFDVFAEEESEKRQLQDILDIIEGSALSKHVKDLSKSIFLNLGEAEAAAHDTSRDNVHFHEVGAVDAIVDIVSASILLTEMGAEKVSCSTISLGSGKVETAHGLFDVPAPAVRHLLRDAPTTKTNISAELTTPTGAAIISTIATEFTDSMPETKRRGFGAGERDLSTPNVLEARLLQ
jgi:pyridinium-3,5-bisthiocarboxylic acid mononucleotide nickel chelatase